MGSWRTLLRSSALFDWLLVVSAKFLGCWGLPVSCWPASLTRHWMGQAVTVPSSNCPRPLACNCRTAVWAVRLSFVVAVCWPNFVGLYVGGWVSRPTSNEFRRVSSYWNENRCQWPSPILCSATACLSVDHWRVSRVISAPRLDGASSRPTYTRPIHKG
jgi:hypothetical protein